MAEHQIVDLAVAGSNPASHPYSAALGFVVIVPVRANVPKWPHLWPGLRPSVPEWSSPSGNDGEKVTQENFKISGVSELALGVADLEPAERFYAGTLGLPVVERWRDAVGSWPAIARALVSGS